MQLKRYAFARMYYQWFDRWKPYPVVANAQAYADYVLDEEGTPWFIFPEESILYIVQAPDEQTATVIARLTL